MFDFNTAKNEIYRRFKTRWDDGVANGLPDLETPIPPLDLRNSDNQSYQPEIVWGRNVTGKHNDLGLNWLHIQARHVTRRQATFPGGPKQRSRYGNWGFVLVKLYFARSLWAQDVEDSMSLIALNCFEQRNEENGLWFREATIVEAENETDFHRNNVMAQFHYESQRQVA